MPDGNCRTGYEPGAGVAQSETDALGRLILEIRDSLACTLVIIEHDIPLLRKLSDVMYALEVGQVIAHGSPDVVLSDPPGDDRRRGWRSERSVIAP